MTQSQKRRDKMKFNMNDYKEETIKSLTRLNNGENPYKSHSQAAQKRYLIERCINTGKIIPAAAKHSHPKNESNDK